MSYAIFKTLENYKNKNDSSKNMNHFVKNKFIEIIIWKEIFSYNKTSMLTKGTMLVCRSSGSYVDAPLGRMWKKEKYSPQKKVIKKMNWTLGQGRRSILE